MSMYHPSTMLSWWVLVVHSGPSDTRRGSNNSGLSSNCWSLWSTTSPTFFGMFYRQCFTICHAYFVQNVKAFYHAVKVALQEITWTRLGKNVSQTHTQRRKFLTTIITLTYQHNRLLQNTPKKAHKSRGKTQLSWIIKKLSNWILKN